MIQVFICRDVTGASFSKIHLHVCASHVFDGDKEHIDTKIIYLYIFNTKPPVMVVVSRGYRWSGLLVGAMVSATMMLPQCVVAA